MKINHKISELPNGDRLVTLYLDDHSNTKIHAFVVTPAPKPQRALGAIITCHIRALMLKTAYNTYE